jgi:hypothetical protein
VIIIVFLPAAAQHHHCAGQKQHRDDGFHDPVRRQTQRTPRGDGDDHVQPERRRYPDEHDAGPVAGAQHQTCQRGLIGQLSHEDDAEDRGQQPQDHRRLPLHRSIGSLAPCSHTILIAQLIE